MQLANKHDMAQLFHSSAFVSSGKWENALLPLVPRMNQLPQQVILQSVCADLSEQTEDAIEPARLVVTHSNQPAANMV